MFDYSPNFRFNPVTATTHSKAVTEEIKKVKYIEAINDYGFYLEETPELDSPSNTVITKINDSAYTEIYTTVSSPATGQFYVDYEYATGFVRFNSGELNNVFSCNYYGLGKTTKFDNPVDYGGAIEKDYGTDAVIASGNITVSLTTNTSELLRNDVAYKLTTSGGIGSVEIPLKTIDTIDTELEQKWLLDICWRPLSYTANQLWPVLTDGTNYISGSTGLPNEITNITIDFDYNFTNDTNISLLLKNVTNSAFSGVIDGWTIGPAIELNEPTLEFLPLPSLLFNQSSDITAVNSIMDNYSIYSSTVSGAVGSFAHGATVQTTGYNGAIYSPTQNRVYFSPFVQGGQSSWHYYNSDTSAIVAYTHSATLNAIAGNYYSYAGGCYNPYLDRIYFAPYNQGGSAGAGTNWHYVNCKTNAIVAYAHNGSVAGTEAYYGAVYHPWLNRTYFIPYNQASGTLWHYVSSTGTSTTYSHGATVSANGYAGGCIDPINNRIYFAPYAQANQTNWHYITSAGAVTAYAHGITAQANGYIGAVYSPTQNRIYLIPYAQANQTNWHYIDCSTGTVVAYAHGATVSANGYAGGVYSPTQNRIYLIPYAQASTSIWHYIDCNTGSVVAYTHGVSATNFGYIGGVYDPKNNRIVLAPSAQGSQSTWHRIEEFSSWPVSKQVMAGPLFNKS